MKLVVGLGNPGAQYKDTLHNAGMLVLDSLVDEWGWYHAPQSIKAEISKHADVVYAKPTTYMNKSGMPVQMLLSYYKLTPEDLIVVHDDIDVPMGEVRTEAGRGAGGHNGVASIIESLGGNNTFMRIRVGIATKRTAQREGKTRDVAKIVLKKPGFFDRKAYEKTIAAGVDAVQRVLIPSSGSA